jgi:transposase
VKGPVDVEDHCYLPMDRLLERQKAIQRSLAKKHLQSGQLVLYDITSTYFEGEYVDSDLVFFGFNRDRKRGYEQVVLGLVCNGQGCPVGVEVFAGNTLDAETVLDKIQELRREYGLAEIVFVGDRGMITQTNAEALKSIEKLQTISALTHRQIMELLERKVITAELFDEKKIVEVIDPKDLKQRYCLCRNPQTAAQETNTRQRLLDLTQECLAKIVQRKKKAKAEKIGAQVGKVLARYKMGKFVEWAVKNGRLEWSFKDGLIAQEKLFDGCYIVNTNVPLKLFKANEVVEAYKKLGGVEKAFRNLKTVSLEIRPVHHKKDERIRSHVFLCVLAYYLLWHMQQRLLPLFEQDGLGKEREWTVANVVERLKGIRRERVSVAGVEYDQVSEADDEQQKILDLLKVKM